MEMWEIALFWLTAGIAWGVACGVMGGHTIVWLLEVVTVSQLVQNYVRNWLK